LSNSGCYGPNYLDSRISQGASRLREGGTCRYKVINQQGLSISSLPATYNKGTFKIIPSLLEMKATLILDRSRMEQEIMDWKFKFEGGISGNFRDKTSSTFSHCTGARRNRNEEIATLISKNITD
jgi:hypothetical protein